MTRVDPGRQTSRSRSVAEARQRSRDAVSASLPQGAWLFTGDVALLLGVSRVYVARLASQDRLPHVRGPEGYMFRADHVEMVANARRVRRSENPAAALRSLGNQ